MTNKTLEQEFTTAVQMLVNSISSDPPAVDDWVKEVKRLEALADSLANEKQLAFFTTDTTYHSQSPIQSMKVSLTATGNVRNQDHKISRSAVQEIDSLMNEVREIILRDIALQDSTTQAQIQKSKESLLGCFPTYFHFTQVDNEYRLKGSYMAACNPWFRVLCPIGYVTIGWRTSVLHIDFKETVFTQFEIANIFSKYFVSYASDPPVVHATSYDDARNYLQRLCEIQEYRRKIGEYSLVVTQKRTS